MMLVVAAAAAMASEAVLKAPDTAVAPGDPVSFSFGLEGTSWLDGCSPVELERQSGSVWVAVARTPCSAGLPATQVDSALVLSVAAPAEGTYRGVVAFGTGCVPARSFGVAACAKLAFVRSEPFTVAVPAAAPQPP